MFASWPGIEEPSAGLHAGAKEPVTPELLQWAQIIFVMEKAHRSKLNRKFRPCLKGQQVVCLDSPDDYQRMEPAWAALLKEKVPRHLPSV